jgi:hypothetical protein
MEVYMELEKKTTILFTPALHQHLVQVARQRGTSLGQLIREACEIQYGYISRNERLKAANDLGALSLPVASPQQLKLESVVDPQDLLP